MTGASQATIASRNHLLHTKLRPQAARTTTVTRDFIADCLASGETAKLVLVVAPAGYGKSTFLAQWTRASSRTGVWFTVEKADNDPIRFWSHFFGAFEPVASEFVEYALEYLTSPGSPSIPLLLTEFINEIGSLGTMLVVLDDYHCITESTIHAAVTFLLDHLPANLQVAIGSRTTPPLPIAKLRAYGETLDVDVSSLRATQDEAERFVLHSMKLELPAETVRRLVERTEGWFAGLQLAALTLRGRPDAAGDIAQFGGNNRYILDYLTAEVLNNQPDDVRGFLIATSLFQRFTAGLCDAAMERADSQEMIEHVEESGVFITRLDDEGDWFRYHALWAELLQRHVDSFGVRAIHARAAAWFEREGFTEDAVRHHLASGDTQRAAKLIEAHAVQELQSGRVASLNSWLEALPEEQVTTRPRLLLTKVWAALMTGTLVGIPDLLAAAKGSLEGLTPEARDGIQGEIAAVEANLAGLALHSAEAIKRCLVALRLINDDRAWLRSHLLLILGIAHYFEGEPQEAFRAFDEAKALCLRTNSRYGWYMAVRGIADAERWQGNLRSAERHYEEIIAKLVNPRMKKLTIAGRALIGLGKNACDRFELDAALAYVQEGMDVEERHERSIIDGTLTLALVQRCLGDRAAALALLGEVAAAAAKAEFSPMIKRIETFRVSLLLAMGELSEPSRWLELNAFAADDPLQYNNHMEYMTVARCHQASGNLGAAIGLSRRLIDVAGCDGRKGHQVQAMALLSECLTVSGEGAAARHTLAQALDIAEPEGYARPFLQENAVLVPLLREIASAGGSFAGSLLRTSASEVPRMSVVQHGKVSDVGLLYEPLTEKERTVLRLLIGGMSNKEIAHETSVSVNTVKTHVRSVYGKLLVSSRAQLVARALELELMN